MMYVREHGSPRESELLYGVITGGNEDLTVVAVGPKVVATIKRGKVARPR